MQVHVSGDFRRIPDERGYRTKGRADRIEQRRSAVPKAVPTDRWQLQRGTYTCQLKRRALAERSANAVEQYRGTAKRQVEALA